jgi:hypothetical protein
MIRVTCAGLTLLFAIAWSPPALGQWRVTDIPPDARALGMGETGTAVASGAFATWWNPGALGLLRGWSVAPFSHEQLVFDGWTRSYAAAGEVRRVGIGAHIRHFQAGSYDDEESESFTRSIHLSAGIDLLKSRGEVEDGSVHWGVGLAFQHLHAHYESDIEDWPDVNGNGWNLDLGTLVRMERPIEGLPVVDLGLGGRPGPPSFYALRAGATLRGLLDRDFMDDPMGRKLRGGLALETGLGSVSPFGNLLGLVATVDIEQWLTVFDDEEAALNWGVEGTALGLVSYRYGESEDNNRTYVSHGLGLRMGTERAAIRFDYGWQTIDLNEYGIHRYSLTADLRP